MNRRLGSFSSFPLISERPNLGFQSRRRAASEAPTFASTDPSFVTGTTATQRRKSFKRRLVLLWKRISPSYRLRDSRQSSSLPPGFDIVKPKDGRRRSHWSIFLHPTGPQNSAQ